MNAELLRRAATKIREDLPLCYGCGECEGLSVAERTLIHVADWLDREAGQASRHYSIPGAEPIWGTWDPQAEVVARAYLGEVAE